MLKLAVACFLCMATVCAFENGWKKVEDNNEAVVKAATYAADELNKLFTSEYHLRLHKVIKAKFQRALGRGYNMKILLALTKCKKAEVGYKDIKKCKFMRSLRVIFDHIKTILTAVKKLLYFSDEAANQYKKCKNFKNHDQDFGLAAEWNFFEISHGKIVCYGIMGDY